MRNKMIMLQRIVDQQAKFREVRMSDNGGEIPDEYMLAYIELLANMTIPTHKRALNDCSLIRRHGGMLTLIRAIEYSNDRRVRAVACQAMRHLCMQTEMTLNLLRAGAAHPLGDMLKSKGVEDRNDGLEVLGKFLFSLFLSLFLFFSFFFFPLSTPDGSLLIPTLFPLYYFNRSSCTALLCHCQRNVGSSRCHTSLA